MKAGFLFLVTFAATIGIGAIFMQSVRAAEPVDAYVIPVPATPQGTSAAILPPGTYFAERSDGVRLSGWVHSTGTRFPMPKKAPYVAPRSKMPQRDPQLRFVPVNPQPQYPTLIRPNK